MALFIGVAPLSAEEVTVTWTGTLQGIWLDNGGVYSGVTPGQKFSGTHSYDVENIFHTDTSDNDSIVEPTDTSVEYSLSGTSSSISSGSTPIDSTNLDVDVVNDEPCGDSEDCAEISDVYGKPVMIGTKLDLWELEAYTGIDANILGFGIAFVSLNADVFPAGDLAIRARPPWALPSGDPDHRAVFFVYEEDNLGNEIFSAWGILDAVSAERFSDVPPDHWAFSFIETLADSGITAGCGNDNYCPSSPVTRAQMAVFLERGIHGSDFSPPAATGNVFLDVAATDFAASFIEQLFRDGITSGCGNNNYCPEAAVTRDQMAVFLLRAKHGSGYSPPPAIGVFNDVLLSHWAVHWIEQLAAEGITSGCGNGNYCPGATVTRDQMAVFLVRTFGL